MIMMVKMTNSKIRKKALSVKDLEASDFFSETRVHSSRLAESE